MKCCFKLAVQLFCEFVIAPFLRDEEGRGGNSQKWHKADNNRPHEEFIMMFKVWGKEVVLVTKDDLWSWLATTEMAPDFRAHTAFWQQVKVQVLISRVIHNFFWSTVSAKVGVKLFKKTHQALTWCHVWWQKSESVTSKLGPNLRRSASLTSWPIWMAAPGTIKSERRRVLGWECCWECARNQVWCWIFLESSRLTSWSRDLQYVRFTMPCI